jgi:peptide/nickel transport system substrate-binding protein
VKYHYFLIPGFLCILLASCGAPMPTVSGPTQAATVQVSLPSPQATPTIENRPLAICAGSEPADLFLYNDPSYIKKAILAALYDGPIDVASYGYQPVILTKLPSLADGDAVIEPIQVQEGNQVVDANGALTVLQAGVVVRPSGCGTSSCALPFQSGTIQMDRMRVTFHMRPGVEWTDGAPVTAADSVFSFKIATDPYTSYGNNGLISDNAQSVSGTAGYKALDDLTIEWTGLPGFFDPNYQVNFFTPLPQHQLSNYSVQQMTEANEVLYSPLGWGAYRVTSWDQGKQMTLEPNPHYFRALEGLPYYNKLVFRFIGQDVDANTAAFNQGQCDILLQDALPAVPTSAIMDLVNKGNARLYTDPQPVFEQLTFNLSPADTTLAPIFSDPQMRRATAVCLDRTSIVNAVYTGLLPPLDLALPADHPLMIGADLTYPFDQGKGSSLLDTLGWKDTDGDGIREAHSVSGVSDGTLLQFTLMTTDSPVRAQVSGIIANQLKACGMDVSVTQMPARDLFAQNVDAVLAGRHFELAELSSPMDVETLCGLAITAEISADANGWSGTNQGGYTNPAFDAACATVQNSLPGTSDYTTSRQTALRIFSNDLPVIPLFYTASFTLAKPNLAGILTGFGQANELQNIESFKPAP